MFAEERKNLVVSMEYLNPIGMPVTIKKRMDERQLDEWRKREDVKILKIHKRTASFCRHSCLCGLS